MVVKGGRVVAPATLQFANVDEIKQWKSAARQLPYPVRLRVQVLYTDTRQGPTTTVYVFDGQSTLFVYAPDDAGRVRPGDYIVIEGFTGPSLRSVFVDASKIEVSVTDRCRRKAGLGGHDDDGALRAALGRVQGVVRRRRDSGTTVELDQLEASPCWPTSMICPRPTPRRSLTPASGCGGSSKACGIGAGGPARPCTSHRLPR